MDGNRRAPCFKPKLCYIALHVDLSYAIIKEHLMRIKARILIPMIIVATLVSSTILISNIMQFSGFVDSKINDGLDRSLMELQNEIELLETKAAHIAALYFANDQIIMNAIIRGNRKALLNRVTEIYNETELEFCVITDNYGKIIARPNSAEEPVDDILMMPSVQFALQGERFTATEYNSTVSMLACSGAPIYNRKGLLIGAVIAGFRLDTNEFVDKHKMVSGSEITIYRGNNRIATTLLQADGTRAVGIKEDENVSRAVLAGNTYSGRTRINGDDLMVKYIPVLNPDGQVDGMLGVGYVLREKTSAIWSFVRTGMFDFFAILSVSVLFILFISERIAAPFKRILDKIHYDALTGIYNRRFFDENLKKTIKSLSRSRSALSLMMIDVDFFKKYNDTYGHSKGDDCLKTVAKILVKSLSRADDFVVRYGGEEFAVVLPNTEAAGARMIAEKLLENIQKYNIPHKTSDAAGCVTISIGVTTGSVNHTQNWTDYVKRADEALYISKQNGRNQYTYLGFSEGQ